MSQINVITGYHAHVYYSAETKPKAEALREALAAQFDVVLGRWHDRPVGPHPCWSYQVAFECDQFAELIPWLSLNRAGLDVLVHPETGHALQDHTDHAMWLGQSQKLKVDIFDA
ncbi:MAG: DOPA 4,5-dioxygenase family protein [Gammaproteobacteria bacterium]|nr:DOPA 4,5-dioxygenase family protein [Gammaproteobacteria bacterium]